jgi:hypothetical protein
MPATLVSTTTLGSNTSTVSWTNIPQTGKDLLIIYHAKSAQTSGAWAELWMRLNNDSSSNYSYMRNEQYNSSITTSWYSSQTKANSILINGVSYYGEQDLASAGKIHIYNYATVAPTPYNIQNASSMYNYNQGQNAMVGGYLSVSSAITSVYLTLEGGSPNWKAGSVFSLYILS